MTDNTRIRLIVGGPWSGRKVITLVSDLWIETHRRFKYRLYRAALDDDVEFWIPADWNEHELMKEMLKVYEASHADPNLPIITLT